jgi:long-chain acyl-CoA synthetase
MNIAKEIFRRCDPDAVAVVEKGASHTYRELDALTRKIAGDLVAKNPARSPFRIGLRCRDGYQYIVFALGILRAQACFVPIPPEISETEEKTLLETLHLQAILSEVDGPSIYSFEPISGEVPTWQHEFKILNPALIRFSSGTTGESKGVLLSHETLMERITAANAGLKIGAKDRVLWVLGMSHHFAVSILLYLLQGAAIILPESNLAGDILEAANTNAATVFYAAPFHYIMLTAGQDKIDWPSLRLAVSTTASLPVDIAKSFANASGIYPAQALGIIEAGLPFINSNEPEKHPSSIGKAQSSFDVLLMNSDGTPCEVGETGELLIKGTGIFDAYIDPWKKRRDLLKDGVWFATGDLAYMDSDGNYYLQGRIKSVINVGGMKFFPEEVEKVLCLHDSVREARVVSRQHPNFGSISVAEVVVTSAIRPAELLSFCKRHLARYKIPAEIVFVESIPKTPSGKILRR